MADIRKVRGTDLFDLAYDALEKGDFEQSERMFSRLLDRDLGNPALLYYLGTIFAQTGRCGLAVLCLKLCVESPKFAGYGPAFNHLGIALKKEGYDDAADDAFARAYELMPDSDIAPSNRAGIFINTGQPEKVIRFADQALAIDPNNPQTRWHKALGLLELGRFKEAWPLHEARKEYDSGCGLKARNYHEIGETPWWDGSSCGTLVIHGEQGLGDEIMFASCLPDIRGKAETTVVECAPRLHGLFTRSFPWALVHGTHEVKGLGWLNEGEEPDFKEALGSLPYRVGRNGALDFPGTPFLVADPDKRKAYRERLDALGPKLKVGIAWQGGVPKTRVDLRSVHLPDLGPALAEPVDWISLQYTGNAEEEIAALRGATGINIHHWPEAATGKDMDDQAALIAELDLVVSICGTAVHVAGGLGVPCLCLTPTAPAWRYGVKGKMPWYRSVTLLRQAGNDWTPTIQEAAKKLAHHRSLPRAKRCAA